MRLTLLALLACFSCVPIAAAAKGTITIVHRDGNKDVYDDVEIKIIHGALYVTSADAKGTFVIHDAACSQQGKLKVCLLTSAALIQDGETTPLDFQRGTCYVNLTDDYQPLVLSTTKVPPHSILLTFKTDKGTLVTLNGRIDTVEN
jgi:hypothetical protein